MITSDSTNSGIEHRVGRTLAVGIASRGLCSAGASLAGTAWPALRFQVRRHWYGMLLLSLALHWLVQCYVPLRSATQLQPRPLPMVEVSLLTQAMAAGVTAPVTVQQPSAVYKRQTAPRLQQVTHADTLLPLHPRRRRHAHITPRHRLVRVAHHSPRPHASAPLIAPLATAPALAMSSVEVPVQAARLEANYWHNRKPVYPETAKRSGWEGRVVLRIRVNAQGQCDAVEIQRSSGHEALDSSALEAARDWRFIPARQGDSAIASTVTVPIMFQIEG